jgi:uncharacterized secreted repeat protein (TIGR03808 family)
MMSLRQGFAMIMDRRRLFAAVACAGAASAGAATPALAREGDATPRTEIEATSLGVRPNSQEDQSAVLQRAIERAAATGAVLRLPPGTYGAAALQLPSFAAIAGVAGTTHFILTGGSSLLSSSGSGNISISGLVLDGGNIPSAEGRGLIHLTKGRAIRIADCTIVDAAANAITLDGIGGEIRSNTIANAGNYAIFSNDAAELTIAGNTVRGAGNNGILVWRSQPGDDGTLVVDNRVEDIANKKGGSGQWGNGINMFRADNVIVRGNHIRNAAYSAIRGNSASNLQIAGNTCNGAGEVAIFVEFAFQGAVVANNIVDGAACGIAIANLDKGGRLAVVQGNVIRNLRRVMPTGDQAADSRAIGISAEADATVNGNVIDNVEGTGIKAGWGEYLRDVSVTANVVRDANYGIAVSVAPGAGTALVANNLISGARFGAIVGMEWTKVVAADLGRDAPERYAQLSIDGNRVR